MPITMNGTQLRCPACANIQPPKTAGIIFRVRAGGPELSSTRILGRCSVCDRMRFLISERTGSEDTPGPSEADREVTLLELAAYVGEGTMSIETAESVAAAPCPEPRKRHIAALVAEGVLKPADAIRLLAM